MLIGGLITDGLFVTLGAVMLALPNRDTPYGVPRKFFGALFCVVGVLALLGIPFGRG